MTLSSLQKNLRTMHLVETLAVALYQGPKRALPKQNAFLQEAFHNFETGEIRHRTIFATLLVENGAKPYSFARTLSRIVGFLAFLIAFCFGMVPLLWFEIFIEKMAIFHYQKILQKDLPEHIAETVREIIEDEKTHLTEMRNLLRTL